MWLNKPASLLCCGLAQVRTVNEKHCYLNVMKSNSCQMPLDTLLHVWAQVSVNQCCMQFRGGCFDVPACVAGRGTWHQTHGTGRVRLP